VVTAITKKEHSTGSNKPITMARTKESATAVVVGKLWCREHQNGSSNSSGNYIGTNMATAIAIYKIIKMMQ